MSDDSKVEKQKSPAAELGKRGGQARAEKLSREQRASIARAAALTRWARSQEKDLPRALHSGVLRIGELELQCFVLENGRRVISQTGMANALGMSKGGTRKIAGDRVANFLAGNAINAFVPEELRSIPNQSIRFRTPQGPVGNGYEATILSDICDVVLSARAAGAIGDRYAHIATRCEILMRGFAKVGIIALIDEATGYQSDRAKNALAEILEEFIAKELRPWVKVFPTDYYKEMFRLRGWPFTESESKKKPSAVGLYTNAIVYERLAPGVLQELKRLTPRDEKGRAKHKYHQRLTEEVGHPKLTQHLSNVVVLMKAAPNWSGFVRMLDRALPRFGHNYELPIDDVA